MMNRYFREYVIMTLALMVFVFGWTAFLIPNEITGGGIAGLSSVIQYATGIPISYSYFTINVVLLIAGFFILGGGFGFKTIFCIAASSLMFEFFPLIPWVSNIEDNLLNALIGGGLSGLGIGIVFTQGGSTGGTDIIALSINKYKNISPGKIYLACDTIIISSILLMPDKSLQDVVYGYIEIIAASYALDAYLTGTKQSVQILIMSDKYNEIADRLSFEMKKGVSSWNTRGWFTKEERNMLMVVVRKSEVNEVMKAVKEIDEKVFMMTAPVTAVYGGVFKEVKH